jgi:dienelactone hydrolase/LysM repeat protein
MGRYIVIVVVLVLAIGCGADATPSPTVAPLADVTEAGASQATPTLPATVRPAPTDPPPTAARETATPVPTETQPATATPVPPSPTPTDVPATATVARSAGGGEASAQPATYRVQAGDTLSTIAARYGVSLAALTSANDIADPNSIRVGQMLVIPDSSSAAQLEAPSAAPTATVVIAASVRGDGDPFAGLTIPDMRARQYGTEGEVNIGQVLVDDPAFTRYYITYRSDGLTVSGMMNVPKGAGPFPVAILNHGYIAPNSYWTGAGSHTAADYLARRGYLTISPDYRGYGTSDDGPNPFRKGYVFDVLNLVELVDTIPQADPERIGMWGHSMGGGIAKEVMVISNKVGAIALYGAMSDDAAENWGWIRRMWNRESQDRLAEQYGSPAETPDGYAAMSPRSYLEDVTAPVIIHHGTADTQVPVEWSRRLAADLEAVGKPVELYIYQGQPHSFQGQDWVTFMARTKAFFDKYLGTAGG